MDKRSFGESNDLVCSLPKDWLNLWPPSSSGGVGYPFHCLDSQNSLALFDTQDRYDRPLSPPLMRSRDWSNMPFSWSCPSARQDNLKTTLISHLDDIFDNIKKNDHLDEDQSDCFHMIQTPDVTETSDAPSCDGICGLTLCTGNQCDNFTSNVCFGDQATKLPLLFTDSDQVDVGIHLSAGNGCNKHMNGSHQVLTEDIPLNFQELLHQDVDSDDSYPLYDGYIYSNECLQVRVGPILPGIHEFPLQGSLESSMMVSGPENNYWGFTCPSCQSITNNNHQEKLKMNCKVPHNQLQASIQFSELSSEGTTDDWCSPVQDDFSTDTAIFQDQGSLTEDCLVPRSKMSSYTLYENTGSVSIPQVTEGLIDSENICGKGKCACLPCSIHATIGHDDCSQFDSVDWWCQRKIDEKVSIASNSAGHTSCIGFDYSQKMYTQEKNRAEDISAARKLMVAQSSAANSKHCLMNPEPVKSGLDQLDSVTDCHNLVENIWNSSLMLLDSHSSESDRLAEPDVEMLLSVIHSLSNYLTSRAGVSAKCIQAAAQPDKSHFGDDSSISKKVSKLAECYYREIDAADYETQVSKSSDICSALRGINVGEGGPYMSEIFAESDQMRGTYYKKAKLSDLEKERESKRAVSELQALVKKLRDDFEFEIKERDAAIILYKDLWSEAHATLSTTMSEMEHIKTEVEALKKKQFNTDAHVLDVIGGGTCKIRERTGLETCLEENSNKKENVMDHSAIYQGKYHKEPDMITSLISPTDIVSKAYDERAFWERASVLIFREEGLTETYNVEEKTSSICSVEDDLNPERNVMDQAAMYQGKDHKETDMNTSLVPPTDIVSKAYDERAFWERAAVLISREEGLREIYKIEEKTSSIYHVEDDLNPQRNVMDQAAMYRGKDHKELDMNTSLILPTDTVSKAYDERAFWERAAVLISCDGGLRENYKIKEKTSSLCPVEDDLNPERNVTDQAAMYQGKDHKEPDMNTSLISPTDIISKAYDERTFRERAAVLISREEGLKEKTSYICPVEDDLNPESSTMEQAAMLPSFRKDCEESQTKTNLNSLINVTSQVHCEDSYWERAASLFSCEQSLGISEISRNGYYFDNDIQEVNPEIEDINRRFKVLEEYKQSDMMGRDSGKQVGEANSDVSVSLNNSLHLEEIIADDLNPESCKSNQVLYRARQGEGTFQERASLLLSREKIQRESVTSETSGKASSECSIKNNLYPKLNVTDQTTILSHQNVSESPVTNKNMNCLRNVIPQEHNEVWKQAAIMFSSQECHGESDRSRNLIMCNQDTMEREKILCRFKVLQECSHYSNITVRDSCKQFGEANFQESGSCNCSHVEENVSNDLNTESYKSNQDNSQAIQGGGLASQNVYPNTDEVQERIAVLYHREASGGEMENSQTVVMSNYFEKQASCMLASEDIHDIVSSAYGTEYFSNSHLGLKTYMTFGREEFPCIVPATESSSQESTLIRNPSILSRSESFSLISVPDVSIDSQSINFVQPISNPYGDLNDTFTAEYSGIASEIGNDFIMDGHNQMSSAGSSSMPKLDLDKKDIIGMQNQNCSNLSRDSADAKCLSQELGCISECQHDFGQDTFCCEMESSSTDSESSWQYVEEEEVTSFQC
ncbi:uncharacterized protein LOC131075709 isoform X1 [Cryptomeria japonica]|uniref:uncharacterized protein LOC131075709 isoform X1 n=2 Tax=Cryptomeria japonica TaxID=3369 RepID=UPI0025AD1EC5|nr:uncharacterized protein LOC131075709 isoform X1 [Cryptomeria japonica]